MHKFFLAVIWPFVCIIDCYSYTDLSAGIETDALAGHTSTAVGIWQIAGNQAGIAELQSPALAVYYRQRFMLAELADKSLAFVYPARPAHLGFAWQVFGNADYKETRMSLGTARKFGENFSAGMRFNRYSTYMNSRANLRTIYSVDAGIITAVSEYVTLGCYVHSLVPHFDTQNQYSILPTKMGLGCSYSIHTRLRVMSEIQLISTSYYAWSAAVQIQPSDHLFLYTGVQVDKDLYHTISFGFSYSLSAYDMGFALVQHHQLGITPSFQLSYRFTHK